MSTETYTLLHVVISLVGIATGLVVMYGWLVGKQFDRWTVVFLTTTVLTSVTGFGFPFEHLLPSHKVGILSLIVLTLAIVGRYFYRLTGAWRRIYVICAAIGLYFNVFVLVVQSFQKVSALKALAPTGSEPAFVVAQVVVLGIFVALTTLAAKRFPVQPLHAG